MAFEQILTGRIEPKDHAFGTAPPEVRRRVYARAGQFALEELKHQLARAIGADGRTMPPRKRRVLPDGSSGPVMTPHHEDSRANTLASFKADASGLRLFWKAGLNHPRATGHKTHTAGRKRKRAKKHHGAAVAQLPFDEILELHADAKARGHIKRDVRLCAASIDRVQKKVERLWRTERLKLKAREAAERIRQRGPGVHPPHEVPPPPHYQPEPAAPFQPFGAIPPLPAGNFDLSQYTFGIGGSKESALQAIAEGRFSGFSKVIPEAPPWPPRPGMPVAAPRGPGPAPGLAPTAVPLLPAFPPLPGVPVPAVPVAAPAPALVRATARLVQEAGGVQFRPSDNAVNNRHVVLVADVDKLEAAFLEDKAAGYYVGPGGTGPSARPGSYHEAARQIAASLADDDSPPVFMPRVIIDVDGNVSIDDGRHRFAAARDLGLETIPVTVDRKNAAQVLGQVGAARAAPAAVPQPASTLAPLPIGQGFGTLPGVPRPAPRPLSPAEPISSRPVEPVARGQRRATAAETRLAAARAETATARDRFGEVNQRVLDARAELAQIERDTAARRAAQRVVPAAAPVIPPPAAAPVTGFGPSAAKVYIRSGEEAGVFQRLKAITGREFSHQDIASLVGATDDARVDVHLTFDNQVKVAIQEPRYSATRTIQEHGGIPLIHNDVFKVKKEFQGQGLGASVLGRQVEHASKWGFDRIETSAARSEGKDGWNGYYTWPRLGYDGPIDPDVRKQLPPSMKDARTVADLMITPERREWWKENGVWTEMQFDLKPGSRSMQAIQATLREPKKVKKK